MTGPTMNDAAHASPEDGLSEEAVELCVGWFARGSKVVLTISPPHANLHANRAALDELVARGHILHEHDGARDAHVYRGTSATSDVRTSPRGRATAMRLLGISE
jgi:hypothetical protein